MIANENILPYNFTRFTLIKKVLSKMCIFQVVKMLVAVVVIFLLCVTPLLLFDFWDAMTKIMTKEASTSNSILTIQMWLRFLSYSNSCTNAFIYYFTSE